jgi:hypothetical protein
MSSFFRLSMNFFCPACRAKNYIESVIESLSSSRDEAAQAATTVPLKCAACKIVAPGGTKMMVDVFPLSADEYAEWIGDHRTSLHTHTDRKPEN